jgi:type IV secretory pathway VirJ component
MRAIVVIVGLLLSCEATAVEKTSFGRFGEVTIYQPAAVRHAALYFSDAAGWSSVDTQFSQALADHGVLVIGIDSSRYAATLAAKPRDKCSYLAGEFEDLSHEMQKRYSPARYHMPVLIGSRYGAQLVYAVTAQGSAATFIGVLTLGFSPTWRPPLKLCQSYELRYSVAANGVATLMPSPQLSTRWIELHAQDDRQYVVSAIKQFTASVGTAKLVLIKGEYARANSVVNKDWQAALLSGVDELSRSDQPPPIVADELKDLSLDEIRATKPTARMALFLTGDGGWAEIDRGVATELAARGIDVVALSSLQYFWKPRSPDETAKDVARVLRHYFASWHKQEVLVIGYSFGADVASFVVNRLPPELRQRIASVSLLGLAESADFEVHVTTWLGAEHHGLPTRPEVERLHESVLCVFGQGEQDSLCPMLHAPNIVSIQVGDGHHFGNDYKRLAEKILAHAVNQQ